MIVFRRLSTCPTLPDLIRENAEARAARWMRMAPIELWCRPSTLLLLRGHDRLPAVLPGFARQSPTSASDRVRDHYPPFAVHGCFVAAWLVLCVGRLLLRCGLITPEGAARALQWSFRYTERGMRLWRSRKLRQADCWNAPRR